MKRNTASPPHLPPLEAWDFDLGGCPTDELEACCYYEYALESSAVRNSVQKYRKNPTRHASDTFAALFIGEAHKFRNDTADGYDLLQKLCKTRTKHRLPDGEFAKKRVMLISATPLNNRPADIRNQVLLFQDGKDSTVIGNLQHFFAKRIKEYEAAHRIADAKEAQMVVARIYEQIREQVVQPLTVRRTRTDLVEDKRWKSDLDAQGIVFPKVEKPRPIFYQLDAGLDALYDRTIRLLSLPESGGLTYNRYRAIAFLSNPKLKEKYERADLVATQLAQIMKTMLVKRIDSSFLAFTKSLRRFRDATQAMLTMFERGTVYIAPSLHVTDYILDEREDELIEAIAEASETDPTITVCTPKDFLPEFVIGLQHDGAVLNELVAAWEQVKTDPKLDEFLSCLRGDGGRPNILAKPVNETGKLIIFSEARDTTLHLSQQLNAAGFGPVLTVDSHNRKAVKHGAQAPFANGILKLCQHSVELLVRWPENKCQLSRVVLIHRESLAQESQARDREPRVCMFLMLL